MEITVNNISREVPDTHSVLALLSELFPDANKGIAVAINQIVVTRSEWQTRILHPHDRITVIRATQGG